MRKKAIHILLWGYGKVSKNIFHVLKKNPSFSLRVYSRHLLAENKKHSIPLYDIRKDEDYKPDAIWVLSKDDEINRNISWLNLKFPGTLFISSSAIINVTDREKENIYTCTLYPLATFNEQKLLKSFCDIPLLIEKRNNLPVNHQKIIKEIIKTLEARVYDISYEDRCKLHLAAVILNNFTTAFAHVAYEVAGSNRKILYPILEQTIQNLKNHNPEDIITGPATRDDVFTIKKHIRIISAYPGARRMYIAMTRYIQSFFKKDEV